MESLYSEAKVHSLACRNKFFILSVSRSSYYFLLLVTLSAFCQSLLAQSSPFDSTLVLYQGDVYFDYMRRLESLFPFIDKQVNTKTGAFLGSSNCEYWYNKGKLFDCSSYVTIAQARKDITTFKPTYEIKQFENNKILQNAYQ